MARHSASGREDALCGVHTADVFGGGFETDEDDFLAVFSVRLGILGAESNATRRRTW